MTDWLAYDDNVTIHNGPATDDSIFNEFIADGVGPYRGISYQAKYQDSNKGHDRIAELINDSAAAGTPWIVAYDEPFWSNNASVNESKVPVWRKNSLWAAYTAGASGVGLYLSGGRDISTVDLNPFLGYYTMMGNTRDLIDSIFDDLFNALNDDSLVSNGWCLTEPGQTYLIYLKDGGATTLDLTSVSGDFDVFWYDPRNYTFEAGAVTSITGGSIQSLGNPPNNATEDWAIIVQKKTGLNLVISDDFEAGFGNWTSGGKDCFLDTTGKVDGTSVNLQDNTSTSVMTTGDLALSAYSQIIVEFSFAALSFESSEDFWLQISTDGGSNYITKDTFVNNVDFVDDGTIYEASISIDENFTDQTRIRFRCDASGNRDDVFIDNVTVSGSN